MTYMAQVTIQQALDKAKEEYIGVPGVSAVSRIGGTIVFYVETEADKSLVPALTFMGFPVKIVVTGRISPLR